MTSLLRRAFRVLPESSRQKIKALLIPRLLPFVRQYNIYTAESLENDIWTKASQFKFAHYQISTLLQLLALGGITSCTGTRVCEIGGDGEFGIARLWHSLTGQPVVVSNPYPNTELSDAELAGMGVELYRIPFEETPLPSNSFDIIYGCAVLEHVTKMHDFFQHAFEILAPGGRVILHGSPLWECYIGHHAYVQCDGRNYFMGQPDCPIPHFGHLIMDEKEMHTFLTLEKDLPTLHADALCHQIYQSDCINRMTVAEICTAALSAAPWQEFSFKTDLDYTAYEHRDFLVNKGIDVKDVQRGVLYLTCKKPEHL
jgi:SAM-dependent methyltransferase